MTESQGWTIFFSIEHDKKLPKPGTMSSDSLLLLKTYMTKNDLRKKLDLRMMSGENRLPVVQTIM